MPTTARDLLLCGLVLLLLAAATVAILATGIAPLTRSWCGDYHAVADIACAPLIYALLSAAALRGMLRLRPLPAGTYGPETSEFAYWKLLTVVHAVADWALSHFTPYLLRPAVARLFGARIGANVAIGGFIGEPFLVTVGEGAVIGNGAVVAGSVIADGRIVIGPVRIGAGATLGVHAVVLAGCTVGDGAKLAVGSMLVPGTTVPPGETWRGNPARRWSATPMPDGASRQGQAA